MLEMRRPVYVEEKDRAVTNKTSKSSRAVSVSCFEIKYVRNID